MTIEQWIGVLLLVVGIYFTICAVRFREFFLYKMKASGAIAVFGEKKAHAFYVGLGATLMIVGGLKAGGLF
ncbi:MAG: hypothetical protein AAGG48_10605 [Planctomycetota bacterium]